MTSSAAFAFYDSLGVIHKVLEISNFSGDVAALVEANSAPLLSALDISNNLSAVAHPSQWKVFSGALVKKTKIILTATSVAVSASSAVSITIRVGPSAITMVGGIAAITASLFNRGQLVRVDPMEPDYYSDPIWI